MSILNNITEASAARPPITTMSKSAKSYPAGKRRVSPEHPGAIIAAALEDAGVTPYAAAKQIGVTAQALHNIINEGPKRAAVTVPMALRLGKLFGNGPELWLNMQRDFDIWHAEREMTADLRAIKTLKPAPSRA